MRKLIAALLSISLLLLPAFSLADAWDGALTVHVDDALKSDDTMTAVIDVINVLGLRFHGQENQVVCAVTLSDEDAVDLGVEMGEDGLYLTSVLFGGKTIFIAMDQLTALAGQLQQSLPVVGGEASMSFDQTIAALQQAVSVSTSEVGEWTEESDRPASFVDITVSAEQARAVLAALGEDSAAMPTGGDKAAEAIAEIAKLLPAEDFLTARIGLDEAGELVYVAAQVDLTVKEDETEKAVQLFAVEERTTGEQTTWEGSLTAGTPEQASFLLYNLFEPEADPSRLNLQAYELDAEGNETLQLGLLREGRASMDENGLYYDSMWTAYTQGENGEESDLGCLHLNLENDNAGSVNFIAEGGLTPETVLASLKFEGKPGADQPARMTDDLYPVTEFTEEALQNIVNDVISENLMGVGLGLLGKLPTSAMSLVMNGMGQ